MSQIDISTKQDTHLRENRHVDTIILMPMALKQAKKSMVHYFINQEGKTVKINAPQVIGQRFENAKWADQNVADKAIIVAIDYTNFLENKDATPNQKFEAIGSLEFIRMAEEYKKNNQSLIQPPCSKKICNAVEDIARSLLIRPEDLQVLSELDLLPASEVKNILPISFWQRMLPDAKFLNVQDLLIKPNEVRSFKLGYAGPEITQLKTDLASIGYDIDVNDPTLDQRTFDYCAALNEKLLGIATIAEQYHSQAITSYTIMLASAMSKAKQQLKHEQQKHQKKLNKNLDLQTPGVKGINYYKKAYKELIDDTNKASKKDFLYGVTLLLLVAALSIFLTIAPFSIPYMGPIINTISAPMISVAAAFMFATFPDTKSKLNKAINLLNDNTEKCHQALNKMSDDSNQTSSNIIPISTHKPTPPPQPGPKPETLEFYGMVTIGMMRDIAIVLLTMGIVVATTSLFVVPPVLSAALFASPMIIGALLGTYSAFNSKIMLMQNADRHVQAFISNIQAENELIKQALETKFPISAEAKKQNQIKYKPAPIQKINTKFRAKKYGLIFLSVLLCVKLVALSTLPAIFPVLAMGTLATIVSKIAISILMATFTTIAIKEYHTINSEKTVSIVHSLMKEQFQIVQQHLDSFFDKPQASYQKQKKAVKSEYSFIGAANSVFGISCIVAGAVFMLSSISLIFLSTTFLILPPVTVAVLTALSSLFAGMLIKYGTKAFLAQTNSLRNIQTKLEKINLAAEATASSMTQLACNAVAAKGPANILPSPWSEYLKLQMHAIQEQISKAEKKINKEEAKKNAHSSMLFSANIMFNRLLTKRSLLSLASLALFNITATLVAFFVAPAFAPVLAAGFALASTIAAEVFDESIFSHYAPMQIAGDLIKSINLSRQKTALAVEEMNCIEQFDACLDIEYKKHNPEIISNLSETPEYLVKLKEFYVYRNAPTGTSSFISPTGVSSFISPFSISVSAI